MTVNSPVPWVAGDRVTVVGGNSSGVVVPFRKAGNGSLMLSLSDEVQAGGDFGGQNGTNTTAPSTPVSGAGRHGPGVFKMLALGLGAVFAAMLTL